jgi:hypothetical protein
MVTVWTCLLLDGNFLLLEGFRVEPPPLEECHPWEDHAGKGPITGRLMQMMRFQWEKRQMDKQMDRSWRTLFTALADAPWSRDKISCSWFTKTLGKTTGVFTTFGDRSFHSNSETHIPIITTDIRSLTTIISTSIYSGDYFPHSK